MKRQRKKKTGGWRPFWAALGASLCGIALVCGLVAADYRTRRIGFGETAPVVCLAGTPSGWELRVHALGLQKDIPLDGAAAAAARLRESWQKLLETLGPGVPGPD